MDTDSAIQTIDTVNVSGVKLQTEVNVNIKNYLRVEAVRRGLTMGQLLNEIVGRLLCSVPEITS